MDCECPLYPADLRVEIDGTRLFYKGREDIYEGKLYYTGSYGVFGRWKY